MLVVAIDYDGTIADTNTQKVQWIRRHLGRTVSPWQCNRTDCVPLIGAEAYDAMGDQLYERVGTLQAVAVPGAIEALHVLCRKASLHLVTARPLRRLAFAREWLANQGVLPCFQDLHSAADASKSDLCQGIRASVLVDDDRRHLSAVRTDGLIRILLQYGSDRRPEDTEGMSFCRDWNEVVRCLESLDGYGRGNP